MYIFQIVKTKHSRLIRNIFSTLLFIIAFSSSVILSTTSKNILLEISDNIFVFTILYLLILVIPIILFWIVKSKIIGKYFVIGTLEFDEKKVIVFTTTINREISLKDIKIIEFRFGTGNGGKSHWSYDTYLASIILKDNTTYNIHLTRSSFKNNIEQKSFIWNNNIDLFCFLKKNKIKFEYNRHLKEKECINE